MNELLSMAHSVANWMLKKRRHVLISHKRFVVLEGRFSLCTQKSRERFAFAQTSNRRLRKCFEIDVDRFKFCTSTSSKPLLHHLLVGRNTRKKALFLARVQTPTCALNSNFSQGIV
jgi:hypothetical protein